jgi:hypothetical protein
MARDELRQVLGQLLGRPGSPVPKTVPVDVTPGCTFGAVVDQRLTFLEESLGELKSRLNGLIFLVVGAVLVEVILRLVR